MAVELRVLLVDGGCSSYGSREGVMIVLSGRRWQEVWILGRVRIADGHCVRARRRVSTVVVVKGLGISGACSRQMWLTVAEWAVRSNARHRMAWWNAGRARA